MRLIAGLLFTALATGCAAIEPHKFVGPNGKTAYSMKCSGSGRTIDACYQKAGELCSRGYDIVDNATGVVAMPTMNTSTVIGTKRSIAIECKQ